jgi:hypothetical protein
MVLQPRFEVVRNAAAKSGHALSALAELLRSVSKSGLEVSKVVASPGVAVQASHKFERKD